MNASPRRALLIAGLGFLALEWRVEMPAATALHRYMDTWRGVGGVIDAMPAERFRLVHLSTVDESIWRATFARSPLFSADGFGAASTPWGAVQQAARAALRERMRS